MLTNNQINRQLEVWYKEILTDWCNENDVKLNIIQPYQYRLESERLKIDIFIYSQKYHNITHNKRGEYTDIIKFLDKNF